MNRLKLSRWVRCLGLMALCSLVSLVGAASVAAQGSVARAAWPQRLVALAGHATVMALPARVTRIAVGDPRVADYQTLNDQEVYVLGRSPGTTNLLFWTEDGRHHSLVLEVQPDAPSLRASLMKLFPAEKDIEVQAVPNAIVLKGSVADAPTRSAVDAIARQHLGWPVAEARTPPVGAQLFNMLSLRDPQQVVLEVKIAEVSKTLIERLGVRVTEPGAQARWSLVPNLTGSAVEGTLGLILGAAGVSNLVLDAQQGDGLVRILAEPNIVALSGQEGRFLAGGRLFIPVALPTASGGTATTLEERPFGVSLGFTPTVLAGAQVQLKVRAEVSEVAREPLRFSNGSGTTVLPAITSRDVSTTVQMAATHSLVIGGLLRNNQSKSVRAFPLLGELPIIGALFRSTDFNDDKTELVIVVTPRLISSVSAGPATP